VVKAGSGVPVRFSLDGNQGLDILAADSPSVTVYACDSGAQLNPLKTGGGKAGLSYSASTDTYTFRWKTQKAWVNTCRHFVLTFTDGESYTADFQFKK
jgi:hypothetical protein